jgi:hypothetical protein
MPTTYEPIATTTLGSAASTITFSSIAATWTDLRIVLVDTPTGNLQYQFRFNSDSGANYSGTEIRGNGSSIGSDRYTGETAIYANWAALASANIGLITCDVFSYAGSTFKTALTTWSNDKNGSGNIEYGVGLWRSTSAITRIDIVASSNNFSTGTTATLYGIKNA